MALNIVDESTLTVAGTSIGLSSADPTLAASELLGARQAAITVLTAPVCYHQDGGAATTSDPVLDPGDVLQVFGDSMRSILTNLRFIRLGSTSATLVIRWYDRDVINVPIVSRGYPRSRGLLNSGVLIGDTSVKATPGVVYWLTVSDSAALAIELNDSTANGGTDRWGLDIPAAGYGHFIFDPPIEFSTGIYLDVSTVTCKVTVGYK